MGVLIKTLWYFIDTAISLYVMLLLFRLLLQKLHANYYNPLCQFVIRITSPVVTPLQRWLPTWKGFDTAVLVVVVALAATKFFIMGWMIFERTPRLLGLIVLSSGDVLQNIGHLFIFLIIGRVVLSWMHSPQLAPVMEVLYRLTEPTLRKVRRINPLIAGHDFTPFVVVLGVQILVAMIVTPIELYGQQLAFQIRPL